MEKLKNIFFTGNERELFVRIELKSRNENNAEVLIIISAGVMIEKENSSMSGGKVGK